MHKKEKFVHVEPPVGYIAPQNREYISMADIERAKAELAIDGSPPRHEQRPTPFNPESLKRPPSQYIHT